MAERGPSGAGYCAGQYSWAFEKAGVLFNVGAVLSHLGAGVSRGSPEGIKAASKLFRVRACAPRSRLPLLCCAAWCARFPVPCARVRLPAC